MSSFEINPGKFPNNYTAKIIIAQWPCVDNSINWNYDNHMFKYVDANDFLHDNLIDYEGNTRAFDYNDSNNWIKQFIDIIINIANDPRTEAPYILIDGFIDIINYLENIDMNFILVIPDSLEHTRKMISHLSDQDPKCVANFKAFAYYRHYVSKKAFRTLSTDEPFYNYLFRCIGIIDEATHRAMYTLLNHNRLIKNNNLFNVIGIGGNENTKLDDKWIKYTINANDTDIINEVERMIKEPDYIVFDSTPDYDICDHEEEYPEPSDCEDCYD